ncbi:hypothetical protein GCM10025859_51400 [Alicyclobacillus fastidiosus]|nr:hypothetical protein GCM10025859_51400 [Alicyclobacillus fastidiosus]
MAPADDIGAHLDDLTRDFVPHDKGKSSSRRYRFPSHNLPITAAHAARFNANQHFVGGNRRCGAICDPKPITR